MGALQDSIASLAWIELISVFNNQLHLIPCGIHINLKDQVCGMRWECACKLGGLFGVNEAFSSKTYPDVNIACNG